MYDLQSRWKLEGRHLVYYGLRGGKDLFKNKIKISKRQREIIASLPCELEKKQLSALKRLVGKQVVPESELKAVPKSLSEASFCLTCAANDYIIPGLELKNGICPMCITKKRTERLRSVVPIKNTFARAKSSEYDIALFYTGGKDSTYLLYYLSKVLSLRVLALTWEIPFMSESAKSSIDNAKKHLPSVTFISKKVPDSELKAVYKMLYELNGNACACPSLAYVMFYPMMVEKKIPYFVLGNEPSQLLGLYYNGMAPRIAYSRTASGLLNFCANLGRIFTLRPPLKLGQLHTLATMKQLAFGDSPIKKLSGYENELVSNVTKAIHTVPSLTDPLRKSIKSSSRSGSIPAFIQIDLDEISGGRYDWRKTKDLLVSKLGWVPPDGGKGLHTSCKIERCKEQSQFSRFYHMKSRMIPFSALEISLASRDGSVSRDEAIEEMKTSLGFSLSELPECAPMKEYIES